MALAFIGDIRRVLVVRKRFPGPSSCSDVLWVEGDAALQTAARINWHGGIFPDGIVGDVIQDFDGPDTDPHIIADAELIPSIAGVVLRECFDRRGGGTG